MTGCGSGNERINADVSGVNVKDITIHRYDLDLFKLDPDHLMPGLESMKPAYRFFLEADLKDQTRLSELQSYLESPRNIAFHAAVDSQFHDIRFLEKDLTLAFRHVLFYYPNFKVPRVYAYISGGDYDYPVQFADSVMLIGLDNYLGKGFMPYVSDGLPAYRLDRMTPESVIVDCMKVLGRITYPARVPGNTLLEQMVDAGKRILFLDAMLPRTEDRFKIGYSKEQYNWIIKNEEHVWAAIIENRMLYTTDGKLIRTFMADGPFTAEFSKESPARLGEWLGWQIVRKYYESQDGVTLQQVMSEPDAQKILSKSGFKPKK